jgi:hypothetical protein
VVNGSSCVRGARVPKLNGKSFWRSSDTVKGGYRYEGPVETNVIAGGKFYLRDSIIDDAIYQTI